LPIQAGLGLDGHARSAHYSLHERNKQSLTLERFMILQPARVFAAVVTFFVLGLPGFAVADEPPLVIQGHGRMRLLVEQLRDRYVSLHPEARIEVSEAAEDSGAGALWSEPAAAAVALARVALDHEIKYVRYELNKELTGYPIAMDAIVFFVNEKNPLASLTLDQIREIYSGRLAKWPQMGISIPGVDMEVFPRVLRPYPNKDFGQFDMLQRMVLKDKGMAGPEHELDGTASVAAEVIEKPTALGYGSLDYPQEGIKILGIKRGTDTPSVRPTPVTVRERSYPLAHYVYLYFAGQPDGTAREFLKFALSPEGQKVVEDCGLHFVALPFAPSGPEVVPEG
jgi:phosphate transport system substrate-binding protein